MARLIETDTNANINISAATAIGAYTANATRLVHVRVAVDQAAGNGDYVIYATLRIAGAGSSYVIIPKTTAAAASGETALMFVSGPIPMDNADVLTIYLDGLAGDTATPDTRVDVYEQDYLRPTIPARTLNVDENGIAWADLRLFNNNPIGSNRLINLYDDELFSWLRNMIGYVSQGEDGYYQFNAGALELAPGVAAQDVADALLLAPSAGDPAAGSAMALLTMAAAGGGSTAYSNTITDTGSNPLDGVEVWITSDSGGASTVASTTTDTLGGFTVYLDPGTYYLWLAKGGYNFGNPTTITVS